MTQMESLSCCPPGDRNITNRSKTPFISIIMPVRNEVKFIERTLTQLVMQNYDRERFEILVVDGSSTDGTSDVVAKFVERYQNVRFHINPRRLGSAARNIALQHARGDVVVIIDGHCELEDDQYLAKLASAFGRSGADCIGRPQPQEVANATPLQRAIAAARASRLGHHPASYVYSKQEGFVPAQSVAVAYRREVFEKVGYFDEHFDACEDMEFNYRVDRAGLRCFFTPALAVHYHPRDSLRGLFRQLARYGRGRIMLMRKHPQTASLSSLLPAVFLWGMVLGLPFCLFNVPLAIIYLSALGLYFAAVFLISGMIAFRIGSLSSLFLPLVFVTIHAACGWGVSYQLLGSRGNPDDQEFPQSFSSSIPPS